jgi:hypothetical protein
MVVVSGQLHALSSSLPRKITPTKGPYHFNTVFYFQDGVLIYGEGACCDLSTVLQSWFCDPLESLEATDVPRCVIIIFALYCSQMYMLHVN